MGRCLCEFSTTFACNMCLDCTANQVVHGQDATEKTGSWLFNYKRDKNNYVLDKAHYDSTFPEQNEDMSARSRYENAGAKSQGWTHPALV